MQAKLHQDITNRSSENCDIIIDEQVVSDKICSFQISWKIQEVETIGPIGKGLYL